MALSPGDKPDYGPIVRRDLIEHLPKLQGAPLGVFMYLVLLADHKTFRITVSVSDVAEGTGYSPTTVKAALRFLSEAEEGYIVNEGSNNPWNPNTYFIPKYSHRGPKSNPRKRKGNYKNSGSESVPRQVADSGTDIDPPEDTMVGQKMAHDSGQPSGQPSGSDIDPPIIDNECTNVRMSEGETRARAREDTPSPDFKYPAGWRPTDETRDSVDDLLHQIEGVLGVWPFTSKQIGNGEADVIREELAAILRLLTVEEVAEIVRREMEARVKETKGADRPVNLKWYMRAIKDIFFDRDRQLAEEERSREEAKKQREQRTDDGPIPIGDLIQEELTEEDKAKMKERFREVREKMAGAGQATEAGKKRRR